jgi:hypothetical protein
VLKTLAMCTNSVNNIGLTVHCTSHCAVYKMPVFRNHILAPRIAVCLIIIIFQTQNTAPLQRSGSFLILNATQPITWKLLLFHLSFDLMFQNSRSVTYNW